MIGGVMCARLIAGAGLVLSLVVGSPVAVAAQQLYECTYTITIIKITTTYNTGTVLTKVTYQREEICRPI